jgi:hypothetical protein
MEDGANNNDIAINWNNILGQEGRSIDNADLGKVQGLFEPFIVTERGTINKEKFYIPKSLIIRYNEEILYFDITEQQAKDYCMRTTPPSEYEAKGIVQILSERRRSGEEEEKKEEETEIVPVREEKQEGKGTKMLEKIPLTNPLSKVDINEEEIIKKIKTTGNEFKDLIISGTKVAKQKIKQTQEIVAEEQANRDAEKISKMGNLAIQFTSSFDDILSDIKTRTYEEQEQIYTGFIKLIEQQRDLIIARRDLAAKLKDSVQKPVVDAAATTEKPSIGGVKKQQQLESAPEDPLLPEIIAATTSTAEDESKIKPQIITAAEKESSEQMTADDKSSRWSRSTTASVKNKKTNRSNSTKTSSTTAKASKVKKNNR